MYRSLHVAAPKTEHVARPGSTGSCSTGLQLGDGLLRCRSQATRAPERRDEVPTAEMAGPEARRGVGVESKRRGPRHKINDHREKDLSIQ